MIKGFINSHYIFPYYFYSPFSYNFFNWSMFSYSTIIFIQYFPRVFLQRILTLHLLHFSIIKKSWKCDLIMFDADSMNLHDVMVKLYKISKTMTIISLKFVLEVFRWPCRLCTNSSEICFFLELYELSYFILLTLLVVRCTRVLYLAVLWKFYWIKPSKISFLNAMIFSILVQLLSGRQLWMVM